MKTLTYDDIKAFACYDPIKHIPLDWKGTILDILDLDGVTAGDRIWVVLQSGVLSDKTLRLFAVACCREIQHLMKDPRSIRALDVAEAYALGKATEEELMEARGRAWDASSTAYGTNDYYAAYSAAHTSTYAEYATYNSESEQIEILKELIHKEEGKQ